MNDTEYVRCNLCGADNTGLVHRINKLNIVRCRDCGLMYVNPRLKTKVLNEIYSHQYFANPDFFKSDEFLYGYWNYLSEKGDIQKSFLRVFKTLERYNNKKGRLLEVGCAMGFFLEIARNNGWQTHGVEISKDAARYAREELGLEVLSQSLKGDEFPKEYFEAVVLLDVIEHLTAPLTELNNYHRMIKPNGVLVLSTINADSPVAKLLGKRWEDIRRNKVHLYIFSKKTISNMLKKTGFKILRIEQYGRYFSIDSICQRWATYNKVLARLLRLFVNMIGIGSKRIYLKPFTKIIIYAKK